MPFYLTAFLCYSCYQLIALLYTHRTASPTVIDGLLKQNSTLYELSIVKFINRLIFVAVDKIEDTSFWKSLLSKKLSLKVLS